MFVGRRRWIHPLSCKSLIWSNCIGHLSLSRGPLWYLTHSLWRVAIIALQHVLSRSVSQNLCFHNQNRLSLWFSLIITEPVAVAISPLVEGWNDFLCHQCCVMNAASSVMFLKPNTNHGFVFSIETYGFAYGLLRWGVSFCPRRFFITLKYFSDMQTRVRDVTE